MILLKKDDREEEFYFAATKKKSQKGKKKDDSSKGKAIKHDAATFKLFDQLKLDAPLSTDEIPDLIGKLEGQLEDYNEKVRIWERDRDEMKRKILAGEVDLEEKKKEEEKEEKKDSCRRGRPGREE